MVRLWEPGAGRPGDQMMGRSGDVHGTSVIHFFSFFFTQNVIVNCSSEKFSEQRSD